MVWMIMFQQRLYLVQKDHPQTIFFRSLWSSDTCPVSISVVWSNWQIQQCQLSSYLLWCWDEGPCLRIARRKGKQHFGRLRSTPLVYIESIESAAFVAVPSASLPWIMWYKIPRYQILRNNLQNLLAKGELFSCPGQLNKWHCLSLGPLEPTNNQKCD